MNAIARHAIGLAEKTAVVLFCRDVAEVAEQTRYGYDVEMLPLTVD
jgi:hypothetical protein